MFASWAGHHVMCVGDYTRDNDYPASVKTIVRKELQDVYDIHHDEDEDEDAEDDGHSESGA